MINNSFDINNVIISKPALTAVSRKPYSCKKTSQLKIFGRNTPPRNFTRLFLLLASIQEEMFQSFPNLLLTNKTRQSPSFISHL